MKIDGIDVFGIHVTGDLHEDYVENVACSVQGIEACDENRGAVAALLRVCAEEVERGAPFTVLGAAASH
jgi:hypothetical protein